MGSLPDNVWGRLKAALIPTSVAGYAAQFNSASSRYLSLPDSPALSTGDIDFSIAAWVLLDSKTANRPIMDKEGPNQLEYALYYDQPSDRLAFTVSSNGTSWTASLAASTLGSPSTATWYFVVAWHDSVANTVNIQVNDGTVDSAAYSAGGRDGTASVGVGVNGDTANAFHDGRIDALAFWKRVLTAQERTWLYNGGSGRSFGELTDREGLLASLIAWWDMEEASGARLDAWGHNDLAVANAVGQAAGKMNYTSPDHTPTIRVSVV